MQVNFRSNQPVATTQPQNKERGVFDTTREAWKTTLKTKETIGAYSSGFVRGLKNAAVAGGALVGIDWLVNSCVNISKGKNTVSHMLGTPFVLFGKSIANFTKFIVDSCGERTFGKSIKVALWDAPKKVMKTIYNSKNVSKVSKWGLPIIALAVAGYTTFRSCLDANERSAKIDHRYGGEVGHH